MRILVVSDSHGDQERLNEVIARAEQMGAVDAFIHLGDGLEGAKAVASRFEKAFLLGGNCDGGKGESEIFTREMGAPLFLCHGHAFHVRLSHVFLKRYARELKARAALFGHTHKPFLQDDHGIMLLNPGAACEGKFALLTIENGDIKAQLY